MGETTPKRPTNNSNTGFSPVVLLESPAAGSPQKNLTGLPRLIKDLAADIYNNIQRWNDLHIKGAGIVKEIASIKSNDPRDFSKCLEEPTSNLYGVVQSMEIYKDALALHSKQIRASEKLQKLEPVFISLNLKSLADLVEDICKAYEVEYDLKKLIMENIAYSKDKSQAMLFAALWTYQTNITDNIGLKLETLLIETGHHKIT